MRSYNDRDQNKTDIYLSQVSVQLFDYNYNYNDCKLGYGFGVRLCACAANVCVVGILRGLLPGGNHVRPYPQNRVWL